PAVVGEDIEDMDRAVEGAGGDVPAVRSERHAPHRPLHVNGDGGVIVAAAIPDLDGVVPAAAGQPLAVGGKGQALDVAFVTGQVAAALVGQVAQENAAGVGGGESLAVGSEGHGAILVRGSGDGGLETRFIGAQIPDLRRLEAAD